jgi:hypothetical protein
MPTLESRLEKAKKNVEDLKDEFEKSLPKVISTRRSWENVKFAHKRLSIYSKNLQKVASC